MKHLDLFSGIGGFALAAQWAGFETVAFCEIEDYPRKVLEKNFPGVPIHRDIRELDGENYAGTALITGGYPCQPFSLAGKRGGATDDRHLWPEMFRIVKQARPDWVVAENVAGHINMGLDQVLSDLEGEGYAARPVVIPACAVDAPHRRDRVWIIANAISTGERPHAGAHRCAEDEREELQQEDREALPDDDIAVCETVSDTQRNGRHQRSEQAGRQARGEADGHDRDLRCAMADTNTTGPQEREIFAGSQSEAGRPPQGETSERDNWWTTEPAVGRVAHGVPRRVDRLKGLGNAIVPQVAYQILKPIGDSYD